MTQAVEIVAVADFVGEESVDYRLVTAFHSLVAICFGHLRVNL